MKIGKLFILLTLVILGSIGFCSCGDSGSNQSNSEYESGNMKNGYSEDMSSPVSLSDFTGTWKRTWFDGGNRKMMVFINGNGSGRIVVLRSYGTIVDEPYIDVNIRCGVNGRKLEFVDNDGERGYFTLSSGRLCDENGNTFNRF
ncbi:MAG: hypothetical protein NC453_18470 [Muribaculum sp.]|nr:hypothetical protein [Muribaculum sp.]